MNIVCFGEAIIDFKQSGNLNFQAHQGGSPLNVAVAAARLGSKVGFAGQVSSDFFGQTLRSYLVDNHVDTSLLLESDHPSSLAFVTESKGDAQYMFMNKDAADVHYNPWPRPKLADTTKFIMFGSISLLRNPAASAIIDSVARHQDQCCIVFDPNIRPHLIQDKDEYLKKLSGWLKLTNIVKVSRQDLGWLYPKKDPIEQAKSWLKLGPSTIIITMGNQGAWLFQKEGAVQVAAPKIELIDTVGAGDSFTGALLTRLATFNVPLSKLKPENWQDILSFANKAAAINCSRAGANPPSQEDIQARFG